MRQLDLQKIRGEQKLTQLRLAELTGYPQGFISQIERGKSPAPEQFVRKVQEVLGIDDLEPYLIPDEIDLAKEQQIAELEEAKNEERQIVQRLLTMLENRDARIMKLEAENDMLRAENDKLRSELATPERQN